MRDVNAQLVEAMEEAQSNLTFGSSLNAQDNSTMQSKHASRGDFPTISVGISFGGGQTVGGGSSLQDLKSNLVFLGAR